MLSLDVWLAALPTAEVSFTSVLREAAIFVRFFFLHVYFYFFGAEVDSLVKPCSVSLHMCFRIVSMMIPSSIRLCTPLARIKMSNYSILFRRGS